MKIGFIGFGEAARAFCDSLARIGQDIRFFAFDTLFLSEGPDGAAAVEARRRQVEVCRAPEAATAGADWIVSAVTAAESLQAAGSVASVLVPEQIFIDINSVSPGRKRETETLLEDSGCLYLDMAVMAPVHPAGHRTPVLLAGVLRRGLGEELDRLGFVYELVGEKPGQATAIKMVRSVFVKGLEAVTVQCLLAAETSGCYERMIRSLANSFPGLGWPGFAGYELERVLKHGVRRAAEMRESGTTLDELGLGGELARAIASVHERVGRLGAGELPLEDLAAAYGHVARQLARQSPPDRRNSELKG